MTVSYFFSIISFTLSSLVSAKAFSKNRFKTIVRERIWTGCLRALRPFEGQRNTVPSFAFAAYRSGKKIEAGANKQAYRD